MMNARLQRILVCDDEPHIREMVGEYLTERGFEVLEAPDSRTVYDLLRTESPDLIILDINLPGEDGLAALRTLRRDSDVPVIMMTAAADVVDRVVGLEMGADDYLGKPVDLRELEARIKAALRRRSTEGEQKPATPTELSGIVAFGECSLDLDSARLIGTDGEAIPITAMEFRLLKVFVEHRGQVLSRDSLLQLAHDRSWDPLDRSIDLRVSRLRRKIERNPDKPEVIRTVRGVGYIHD